MAKLSSTRRVSIGRNRTISDTAAIDDVSLLGAELVRKNSRRQRAITDLNEKDMLDVERTKVLKTSWEPGTEKRQCGHVRSSYSLSPKPPLDRNRLLLHN